MVARTMLAAVCLCLCGLALSGCPGAGAGSTEGLANGPEFGRDADLGQTIDALCIRGENYFMDLQFDLAIDDFTRAIELMDSQGSSADMMLLSIAYLSRAKCHLALERFEMAATDFTKAIELRPDWGEAYVLRGHSYLMQGDTVRARADMQKADDLGTPAAAIGLQLLDDLEAQ